MANSTGSVRCLHISDVHLSGLNLYDENRLASSLCAALPKLAERFGHPDFIVFSGDIAKTGAVREYHEATKFFDKLLEATSISKDRLFVVPGNHDVDRKRSTGLARTLTSRTESDSLFSGDPVPHIANRQINFKNWYEEYFEHKREFLFSTTVQHPIEFDVEGTSFSIWCINSAAFSFDDHDQGKLLIGQRCLEEALDQCTREKDSLQIAVLHHPLFWLSEVERSSIKALLKDNFDLVLHGHLHETSIEAVIDDTAGVIIAAAGAVYQGSQWPNTAHFLEFSESSVRVLPIMYIPSPRETWALDTSVFPDSADYCGAFNISGLPISLPQSISDSPQTRNLEQVLQERLPDNQAPWLGQLFVTPHNEVLYVEPRLCRKRQTVVIDVGDADFITVKEVALSTESYIVDARPEYGGSALLGRMQREIMDSGQRAHLVNANSFPNYKRKILDGLGISEAEAPHSIDVLIDNFEVDRDRRLLAELRKIECVRRIICVSTNRGLGAPSVSSEIEELPFTPIRIHLWALGRTEVRELGAKFFDSRDDQHISQLTSKVYDDLLGLRIPLTPANVIMYLKILYNEGNFRPVNRVDILDRFLTESLRKPSDSYSGSFNYKNKLDLTGAFAGYLFDDSVEMFSDRKWFEFCDKYKSETLMEFSAKEILDELVSAKIVSRYGDNLFFRYSFFFGFFLGRHLSQNSGLLKEFLDNRKYLSVSDVLDVVSAFKPNDPSLIEAVSRDLKERIEEFSQGVVTQDFDPLLGAIWPANDREDEQLWTPVTNAISSGPAKTEQIDILKTSYLAEARTEDQSFRIKKFVELEYSLFLAHHALSDLLKNGNDIGKDRKLEAYELLLQTELVRFK